ncbi:MAG: alcohol dehydrogenase catalytic domain-containing protein [Patescibacteria group bacterium]
MLDELPKIYQVVELSSGKAVLKTRKVPTHIRENPRIIVVRPHMVGICRSDVKELLNVRTVRHDFGHEIAGTVAWAGNATGFHRNERVIYDPHVPLKRTSGFGTLILAEGHKDELKTAFLRADPIIPSERLVFCEPLACAHHCVVNLMRAVRRDNLSRMRIAIIGAGNAGALIGLTIKYYGGTPTLFNRTHDRLTFLAHRGLYARTELKTLRSNANGEFDAVIPATTFLYTPVVAASMRLVKPGGTVLLFGGTKKGDMIPDTAIDIDGIRRGELEKTIQWRDKKIKVAGTHGANTPDLLRSMQFLRDRADLFALEKMITATISLSDLPETLTRYAREGFMGKTVVTMH